MCESHFMKIAKLYKCLPFMAVTCVFKYCYVQSGAEAQQKKKQNNEFGAFSPVIRGRPDLDSGGV